MGPCKQLLVHLAAAAVVALGSNVVPMEVLEARLTKEAYIALVKNAAAAGMTMLRVWGGGIFFDDAFYDACDEAGVMLYHDMMCVRIGGGAARLRASAASSPVQRVTGTPDMTATISRTITAASVSPSRRRNCSSRSVDWRRTLRSCSGAAATNAALPTKARKPPSHASDEDWRPAAPCDAHALSCPVGRGVSVRQS